MLNTVSATECGTQRLAILNQVDFEPGDISNL